MLKTGSKLSVSGLEQKTLLRPVQQKKFPTAIDFLSITNKYKIGHQKSGFAIDRIYLNRKKDVAPWIGFASIKFLRFQLKEILFAKGRIAIRFFLPGSFWETLKISSLKPRWNVPIKINDFCKNLNYELNL